MKNLRPLCVLITVVLAARPAVAVMINTNTTINAGDLTYESQDLIVTGCTLTVNGPHGFTSLQLANHATLTHTAAPNGETNNCVNLTIAGNLTVDATSQIFADGLGYGSGQGPGAGTRGVWAAGGGHGGNGGTANGGGGAAYGSLTQPVEFGSGGADAGNPGGGAIHLVVAGTLFVDGTISANGGHTDNHGGGAGGSIWLDAGTMAGNGTIQANGATGGNDNGGAGGRIAITCQTSTFAGVTTVWGGLHGGNGTHGGAGTIFWKLASEALGGVLVDNDGFVGADTPANLMTGPNLVMVVTNGTQVVIAGGETWAVNRLIMATNTAVWCYASNTTGPVSNQWIGAGIAIQAQSISINTGAVISADGLGYAASQGPGAGTRGSWAAGGGHGGNGGTANGGGGAAYGSLTQPTELGSGGADTGNPGGGAIHLVVAGALQVEGVITANGGHYNYHGGGAGGSIWCEVGTIGGTGIIQVNGAQGGNDNGGGGGRIAINYQTNTFAGNTTAFGGGHGGNGDHGGAGTVFWKGAAEPLARVTLDNNNRTGAYTPADLVTGTNLVVTVTNGTQMVIAGGEAWAVNQLTVATNSTVWCQATNTGGQVSNQWVGAGIAIQAQSVVVQPGAVISADSLGYGFGQGPGAGTRGSWAAGGGHGGNGGTANGGGGAAYGSLTQPTELGSGGADTGNPGGGAIHLVVAGALQVEGVITANGGHYNYHGGGAGGSILIEAGNLAGRGTIQVNGAQGGNDNGGGGGRIAISYQTSSFVGTLTAAGGAHGSNGDNGGAGTIYQKGAADALARVVLDNAGTTGAYTPADLVTGAELSVTLTNGAQVIIAGGETWTLGQLVMANNSIVWGYSAGSNGVAIHAQAMTINAGAVISADGLGYGSGQGPGAGTRGSWAAGAGHGGMGGTANGGGGLAYGLLTQPTELGSGGADPGNPGGGAIHLVVSGTLFVDGTITANGGHYNYHGGGAGGSLWLDAGTIAGNGTIQVNGANGGNDNGGGGGRIAITYLTNTFAGVTTAWGGLHGGNGTHGGAGTIYWKGATDALSYVVLDNDGQTGAYTPADLMEGTNLVVTATNGTQVAIAGGETWVVNQLILATNTTVWCFGANTTGLVNYEWLGSGVVVRAQTILIQTGAVVSAAGLGYDSGQGPGAGTRGAWAAGGGYGGAGGTANGGGGGPYGSAVAPLDLGSGGADAGNPGGGAIHLIAATTLQVDGSISVNGAHYNNHGGGAGGSVLIEAGTLSGNGSIQANGAQGGNDNGGGGGRVAVYYWNAVTMPASNITVVGGAHGGNGENGSTGTVYFSSHPYFNVSEVPALLHGVEGVNWTALGLNPNAPGTAEIMLSRAGNTIFDQTTTTLGATAWDTRAATSGVYQLLITFRDANGNTLGQLAQNETVNNSVAWHAGILATNETWSSNIVHIVEGTVIITNGITVTVMPGAIVKFARGTGIEIKTGGILDATGATLDGPVIFTSLADDTVGGDVNMDGNKSRPQPGDWAGVAVQGGQFNANDYLSIRFTTTTHAGPLAGNQVWMGNMLHIVTDNVTVPSGVSLTINPGSVVKFAAGKALNVSYGGTVTALGTLAQPIAFTSLKDDAVAGDSNGDGDATTPDVGDWDAIYVNGGQASFDHVAITYGSGNDSANYGGLLSITDNRSAVTVSNSVLSHGLYRGLHAAYGNVSAANTVVTDCDRGIQVGMGGGANLSVVNCTLDGNNIGMFYHGGTISVRNTIVVNSLEWGIANCCGTTIAAFEHNDIWSAVGTNYNSSGWNYDDQTGLNGNISVDPKFKNGAQGDFRLNFGSLCIDAADGITAPATDATGAPRYSDPRTLVKTGRATTNSVYADIGAFEFVESAAATIDLIATGVSGPLAVMAGQTVTMQWTVVNIGTGSATGPWHDAVAFTALNNTNNVLAMGEQLLGQGVVLGPGQSYAAAAAVTVPGGAEGNYLWQVRVNSRGEIFEGANWTNNISVAATPTGLSVPALAIGGTAMTNQFTATGQTGIYKVTPGAGQNLLLSLQGNPTGNALELYVGQGYVPDPIHFDLKSSQFNSANASVLVSHSVTGTYYVATYARSLSTNAVTYTLTATIPSTFAVTSFSPGYIAGTGPVTIQVNGSLLAANDVFQIVGPGGTFTATKVSVPDSTTAYVTFNLGGVAAGNYSLQVTQPGSLPVAIPGPVQVQPQTSTPQLSVQLQLPQWFRVGRAFSGTVVYQNVGNTDLPAPIITVGASGQVGLRRLATGSFSTNDLLLIGASFQGPAGVLRPGQSWSIPFEVLCTANISPQFYVYAATSDSANAIDYSALESQVRPTGYTDAEWSARWALFQNEAGAAWGGFVTLMADYATLMSEENLTGSAAGTFDSLPDVVAFAAQAAVQTEVTGTLYLNDVAHPLASTPVALGNADGSQIGDGKSGTDGTFTILNLTNDTFSVTVPGYWVPQPAVVTLAASGSITGLTVIVRHGGGFTGIVSSQTGGAPLSNILVQAISAGTNGEFAATTSSNGTFVLAGLPPGAYDLLIGDYPYATRSLTGLTVANGQTLTTNVVLALDTAAAIEGYVLANGAPVADAWVELVDATTNLTEAVTDAAGYFRCVGGLTGQYALSVTADGFAPHVSVTNLTAGVLANAGTITLLPGASITMTWSNQFANVVIGGLVTLLQNGAVVAEEYAGTNGVVSFTDLAAGTYTVLAQIDGFQATSNTVVIGTGAAVTNAPVMTQLGSITGRLTDGSSQPIADMVINVIGIEAATQSITNSTATDADGRYALLGLPAGQYAVSIGNEGGIGIHEVTIPVTLTPITLNLSLAASVVRGVVLESDGSTPVAYDTVRFAQSGQLLATATTDTNGVYVLRVLVPGTYNLSVETTSDISSNLPVTVPGNTNLVAAPLILGALQLSGIVQDGTGHAVSNALVQVVIPDGNVAGPDAVTSTNGGFSITGLVAGQYRVLIQAFGFADLSQLLTVAGDTNAMFALTAGVTVTGQLTDATTSHAVGNATVAFVDRATQFVAGFSLSDSNGNYTAYDLATTNYDIIITAEDYQIKELPNTTVTGNTFVLNASLAATNALVQGTVTDVSSNPVANATVRITDPVTGATLLQLQPDATGHWRTPQLAAGSYRVAVAVLGYLPPTPVPVVVAGTQTTVNPLVVIPVATDDFWYDISQWIGEALLNSTGIKRPDCDLYKNLPDPVECPECTCGLICVTTIERPSIHLWLAAHNAGELADKQCDAWRQAYEGQSVIVGANTAVSVVNATKALANTIGALGPKLSYFKNFQNPKIGSFEDWCHQVDVQANTDLVKAIADVGGMILKWPVTVQDLQTALSSQDGAKITGAIGGFAKDAGSALNDARIIVKWAANNPALKDSPWLGLLSDWVDVVTSVNEAINSYTDSLDAYEQAQEAYIEAVKRFREAKVAFLEANHCPPPKTDPCYCVPAKDLFCCQHPNDCRCNPDPQCCQHPDQCQPHKKITGDPNDKLTTGIGSLAFVRQSDSIAYTVLFENVPTANAPVQTLIIVDHLDPNLDWSTLQLNTIGFNNEIVPVPAGLQSFTTNVFVSTDRNPVQVVASLNPTNGVLTWTITSIDPVTGQLVTDPLAGFLPPNTGNGVGDGYVSYTIQPKTGLPSGTQITNQAIIVFDVNAPISTPITTNTIDSLAPQTAVSLPAAESNSTFMVRWNGSDTNGSGIQNYTVFVSANGGTFTPWLVGTTNQAALFTGQVGSRYAFYSTAVDNVGNIQTNPATATPTAVICAFASMTATYNGLVLSTNAPALATSGALKVVLSKTGVGAANLVLGGKSYTFQANFDKLGHATNTVARSPLSPLQVILNLDGTSGAEQIEGTISDNHTFTALVLADRAPAYTTKNPCPWAGTYTLVLVPADARVTTVPQGYGYATLIVSATGLGSLTGVLGDGTKVTAKLPVSKYGTWPLYAALSKNAGAGIGWVSLATNTAFTATVDWFAPASKGYAAFSTTLSLAGAKYTSGPTLTGQTWDLTLSGGGLTSNLLKAVAITAAGKATVVHPGPDALALKLTPKTGQFSGSFKATAKGKAIPFTGLLLQTPVGGFGQFQTAGKSGAVTLEVAP